MKERGQSSHYPTITRREHAQPEASRCSPRSYIYQPGQCVWLLIDQSLIREEARRCSFTSIHRCSPGIARLHTRAPAYTLPAVRLAVLLVVAPAVRLAVRLVSPFAFSVHVGDKVRLWLRPCSPDDAFFLHHMCSIVLVSYIAPAYIVSHLLVRSHGDLDPMLIQIKMIK